jgi:hypothetical protein
MRLCRLPGMGLAQLPLARERLTGILLPCQGLAGIRLGRIGLAGLAGIGLAGIGLAGIGLARIGLARIGLARIGLARIGLARIGLARIGLARIGLARIGLARIGLTRVGGAGVRLRLAWMGLSGLRRAGLGIAGARLGRTGIARARPGCAYGTNLLRLVRCRRVGRPGHRARYGRLTGCGRRCRLVGRRPPVRAGLPAIPARLIGHACILPRHPGGGRCEAGPDSAAGQRPPPPGCAPVRGSGPTKRVS